MALCLQNIFKKNLKQNDKQELKSRRQTKEIYEKCVICGKLTTVKVDIPIEFRYCYEIGLGQVCYKCHRQITEDYCPTCLDCEDKKIK